jgi:hypothetical protein
VRRADLGARARQRALAEFTLDRCVGTYRGHYAAIAAGRVPSAVV